MQLCSRYWGKSEGCFGIVWQETKECWLRTSNTSTDGLISKPGYHSAFPNADDMKPLNEDCPAAHLSTHTLDNNTGIEYTVHCEKVIGTHDICWEGYPSCLQSPFIGFHHADSLEECLQFCAQEHPLCRAVSYNPGLKIGYANCWPKNGFEGTLDDPPANMGVFHSATITGLDTIDTKCPDNKTYTANATGGSTNFEIHCGQMNGGTNMTSLHTQNITACMDECASTGPDCVGVAFDSSLQGGYQNCYLQNTTSVITDQAAITYAIVSDSSNPSSSGGPSGSSPSSSPSKAWIAGPVIGGIAALGLIGSAIFFIRRRRQKGNAGSAGGTYESGGTEHYEKDSNPYSNPMTPAYSQAPPSELGGRGLSEAAGTPVTKYARRGDEMVELPT